MLDMNVVPVFNENDAISKGVVKATVSLPLPAPPTLPLYVVLHDVVFYSGSAGDLNLQMCQATCEPQRFVSL